MAWVNLQVASGMSHQQQSAVFAPAASPLSSIYRVALNHLQAFENPFCYDIEKLGNLVNYVTKLSICPNSDNKNLRVK